MVIIFAYRQFLKFLSNFLQYQALVCNQKVWQEGWWNHKKNYSKISKHGVIKKNPAMVVNISG